MGSITFKEHDGTSHVVDLEVGQSLMQLATANLVPGIDADCGGSCACGTCHVILDQKWISKTGNASSDELQMLDLTPERAETSRLACQVQITEEMDGMVVQMPEFQM